MQYLPLSFAVQNLCRADPTHEACATVDRADDTTIRPVLRLKLGTRSDNPLPVTQRIKILTNGIIVRTWVVGRGFEYHIHHEKRLFLK